MTREGSGYVYSSVVEFVENYLSVVYRRDLSDPDEFAWCPEWFRHAEAAVRLDALWRAWEYLRRSNDPDMSVWFLDHADPHMRALLDPRGPFRYCRTARGHSDEMNPLPLRPAPGPPIK